MKYHESVLLQEAIVALNVKTGKKFIDATMGGGGHSLEIIKHGGIVLGLDFDQDAIDFVEMKYEVSIKNHELKVARGNFKDIDNLAYENGFEKVLGILFDLGVSSNQIDKASRGFSYLNPGPLDMRMDQALGVKASDLVNGLTKDELIKLFNNLGDEYRAKNIAENIVTRRKEKPIETTDELVGILAHSYGFREVTDFAKAKSSKKVFQALRIAVNDELGSLKVALPKALELIEKDGRLVVITFHSLEDRIVKQLFKEFEIAGKGLVITKKPILPSVLEKVENSRSKSAKLRIFEKL